LTPSEVDVVHQIGADTAFYGAPVEQIFDDRRLFIDVFMRPYTGAFLDTCWVAMVEDTVAGYLIGCLNTAAYEPLFRHALLKALARTLRGRYRIGWRTIRAMIGFVREQFVTAPALDLVTYPAHLHINLSAPYRGQGIGRQLMETYLDHCRSASVPGVFLTTSSQNTTALHLYEKLGFCVLHRHRSPYHSTISRQPVDHIRMGLPLDAAD
jgi:ribosomal protein S18 acetylase RimI-like enzyme